MTLLPGSNMGHGIDRPCHGGPASTACVDSHADGAVAMDKMGEVVAVAAGVAAQDPGPVLVATLAAGGVVRVDGAAAAHPFAG